MYLKIRPIILIPVLVAFAACGRMTARPDLGEGQVVHYNSTDRADLLADEAEAMLKPETLASARAKFRQALAADPKNERARFWVSMIELFHEFEGVYARVKPAYLKSPKGADRYNDMLRSAQNNFSTEHFKFLSVPRKDLIGSSAELAEWMDRVRLRIAALRTTLREIRDSEFTITVSSKFLGSVIGRSQKDQCTPIAFGPVKYQPLGDLCATEGRNVFGLARADFDLLQAALSSFQLMLDFWTAYRVNPETVVGWTGHPIENREEADAFTKSLFSANFNGDLVRPAPFATISEMGADFLAALRYQKKHQRELCPLGQENPQNRRGYLVSVGSCIVVSMDDSEYERTINGLEATLSGRPYEMEQNGPIQYNALISNPPKNAKAFLPFNFDECGRLKGFNTDALKDMMTEERRAKLFESDYPAPCPGGGMR